jgi:hypothetical protein
MRITEEYIQEKIAAGKIKDFTEGSERSQLRRFIRQNKLSKENIIALWNIVDMQWELAKHQELPVSLIKNIIALLTKHKDRQYSTTFREIILNQKISDDIIKLIDYDLCSSTDYLMAWEAKPLDFYRVGNFKQLLDNLDSGLTYKEFPKLNKALIAVALNIPETVREITEKVYEVSKNSKSVYGCESVLQNMAKKVYFEDDIIDFIRDNFDESFFYSMMERVVIYNTCSQYQRARFLLEK